MNAAHASADFTATLAEFIVSTDLKLATDVTDTVERAVVDTVAAALGAHEDLTVATLLTALSGETDRGASSIWTTGGSSHPRQAALLNGTAAHALDFDDVDDSLIGHPSAVLVPAALAVAEDVGAAGHQLVAGYWVGLLTMRALAAAIDIQAHYSRGWHSTGTLGALGAAATVSRMLDLSRPQTQHALGIAASLSGGSRQNFGSMTKPLHAGVAASSGVLAGTLASSGYTADLQQLEGPAGFLALFGATETEHRETALSTALSVLQRSQTAGINVKLYPCCYYAHAAIDAMLELVGGGLTPARATRVKVQLPPGGLKPLIHHSPATGLQGKFSLEYAVTAALLDGSVGMTTFTDEAVNRAEVRDCLARVQVEEAGAPPVGSGKWDGGAAVVEVTTDDEHLFRRVDRPRGHFTRPAGEDELRQKFADCVTSSGGRFTRDAYDALRGIGTASSVQDALQPLVISRAAGVEVTRG